MLKFKTQKNTMWVYWSLTSYSEQRFYKKNEKKPHVMLEFQDKNTLSHPGA